MSKFYIEKVTVKGDGKSDSVVEFGPGLNLIQGRSNTGKTCIIKCIDYCFGSKQKPFNDSLGYNTIVLTLRAPNGTIQITRVLGKNQVQILTTIPGYKNGIYDLVPKVKKEPLPLLSDLLLAAIGIEEKHDIIKNKMFERKRLTWRTFIHLLIFHVADIAKEISIIEPEQSTEKTAFYSALLFLLFGNDFKDMENLTEGKLGKIKKQAVEDYVNKKIRFITEHKKKLEIQLKNFNGIDIEQTTREIINHLKQTEEQISGSIKESRNLFRQIVELQRRATECELLKSRFASLHSQYISDIKRLSFIVNGEMEKKKLPVNQNCPFCNSKLPILRQKTYVETAQAELSRITKQMNGLTTTERDIAEEQIEITKQLEQLRKKREELERLISQELQPKANAFQESLNNYKTYIQIKNELEVIERFASSCKTDLIQLPEDKSLTPEFHPKEQFGNNFQEEMNKLLKNALTEGCYENLSSSSFNMQDFDVEVNGHKKSSINGQGYTSYLNSIIAIVFRLYLNAHAKYDPGFVVIDTPLLGLDQGVSDATPESMRTALFRYFMNHQNAGQIIILENIKHIPKLDYKASGVNVITFTKGYTKGRYGFLTNMQ